MRSEKPHDRNGAVHDCDRTLQVVESVCDRRALRRTARDQPLLAKTDFGEFGHAGLRYELIVIFSKFSEAGGEQLRFRLSEPACADGGHHADCEIEGGEYS